MKHKSLIFIFLVIFWTLFDVSHANPSPSFYEIPPVNQASNSTLAWRDPAKSVAEELKPKLQFAAAGLLSFIAAAISSAGGIGGGGLYIPILTIVAGLELKTASSYSAFMVTGGSIANVGYQMLGERRLIDYDIALLSEPCMLLGVSCGVICNLVLPEWLITAIFAVFLAFSTFRTCRSGVLCWGLESRRSSKVPLLDGGNFDLGIPLMKLGMLLVIWFSFFVLYLLRGNRYGQGIINIEVCGPGYWIISAIQIPIAIIFSAWILHCRNNQKNSAACQQESEGEGETSSASCHSKLFFPVMALLAGLLGGVFGIGGGMLISPLLLQIGIRPEVTAATCSFMVFFSSTMSAIQYLLLGMDRVCDAITYAAICFVASLVGLTMVQRAIMKYGRASLIVFSVGTVMALSTVLMTGFGAVDVWKDYVSGKNMGFKKPC